MIQRHCKEARLRFGKVEHVDEGYFPKGWRSGGKWRVAKLEVERLEVGFVHAVLQFGRFSLLRTSS